MAPGGADAQRFRPRLPAAHTQGLDAHDVRLRGGRALIAELVGASILRPWSPSFGRPLSAPRFAQPPESSSGYPTGPSCNVWALGRLFARMHMGADPLEAAVNSVNPDLLNDQAVVESEEEVHKFLAETFDVREDPLFASLDEGVRRLLPHLLDRDPETRWTAAEAIEEAWSVPGV